MRLITPLAIVSLLLAACVPREMTPSDEPVGRACTEIGCTSLLTVQLADTDLRDGESYSVEVCVDGQCAEADLTLDQGFGEANGLALQAQTDVVEYRLPEQGYGPTAEVSVTLADGSGTVLAEAKGEEVPIERSQPNGPGCPPVCFTGRLTV